MRPSSTIISTRFWHILTMISELLELSLCWTLCSLPVITAVPAAAALYHTCALCVRRGESGAFSRFLRSFSHNLKDRFRIIITSSESIGISNQNRSRISLHYPCFNISHHPPSKRDTVLFCKLLMGNNNIGSYLRIKHG